MPRWMRLRCVTRKYLVDTNIYIGAIRDSSQAAALNAFMERNAPVIGLGRPEMCDR
jgi:hypothetical protein